MLSRLSFLLLALPLVLCGCAMQVAAQPGALAAAPARHALSGSIPTIHQQTKPPSVPGAALHAQRVVVHPGDLVTLQGFLPLSAMPGHHLPRGSSYGNLCFGGCGTGLMEQAIPVIWNAHQPGHFTMVLQVPPTAWIASDGVHVLSDGTYRVGFQCVAPVGGGCALIGAQASTLVRLAGAPVPPQGTARYGHITLSPAHARPGDLVTISGWAPLTDIIGRPFGYSLVLSTHHLPAFASGSAGLSQVTQINQSLNGSLSGSMRLPILPAGIKTAALQAFFAQSGVFQQATLAPVAFTVDASPAWQDLGTLHPLSITPTGNIFSGNAVTSAPADPKRLARCTDGVLAVSSDGGKVWTNLPLSSLERTARSGGYILNMAATAVRCTTLVLGRHPGSIYISLWAQKTTIPAPPTFQLGYVTTDGGAVWKIVPPPHGYTIGNFGGFQQVADGIDAFFLNPNTGGSAIMQSKNGGKTWTPGQFTCPALGPCLRFGSAPSEMSGMGANYDEPLMVSLDGGRRFTETTFPGTVMLNFSSAQLVAVSKTHALLLSGQGSYPLLMTTDSGRAFENITLPAMPQNGGAPGYNNLQMLPDGALLAQNPNTAAYMRLDPASSRWCAVPALPHSLQDMPHVIGTTVWITPQQSSNAAAVPRALPLSALACAKS